MGQCYYIEAKIKPKDEEKLVRAGLNFIEQKMYTGMVYFSDFEPDQAYNIPSLMEVIFTKRGTKHEEEEIYTSFFDASYGWESIMCEFFRSIAPYLKDDSSLYIEPDEGSYTLRVKEGRVINGVLS